MLQMRLDQHPPILDVAAPHPAQCWARSRRCPKANDGTYSSAYYVPGMLHAFMSIRLFCDKQKNVSNPLHPLPQMSTP